MGSYEDKREDVGEVLSIDLEGNKQALQDFLSPEVAESTKK